MLKGEYLYSLIESDFEGNATIALDNSIDSKTAFDIVKSLAIKLEVNEHVNLKLVPTSLKLAMLAKQYGLNISDINSKELDLAVFSPNYYSKSAQLFVKNHTDSLIKDKICADSASKIIVVPNQGQNSIPNNLLFEVSSFGYKRTLNVLDCFGKADLLTINDQLRRSETGNLFVSLHFDNVEDDLNLQELTEYVMNIPGVLESSLFTKFVDKIVVW